ncbi:hypothetical protein ACIBI4_10180 [Streptomyces sp. NPDC050418]|uniref:hypothetical protein n=1 Tax=Streptomyces sp. NPDC050418 TaxID=3365612 RepID=UPI00379D2A69
MGGQSAELGWDPGVARWSYEADGEGGADGDGGEGGADYALPRSLRSLTPPWDRCLPAEVRSLPRTEREAARARHVLEALLDDPPPPVPRSPAPGLLEHAWEWAGAAVRARMPHPAEVTWARVDALAAELRPGARPLELHALTHIEATLLWLIADWRTDVAESVWSWLALDATPERFAAWAVPLAERSVTEGLEADEAIAYLGAVGAAEALARLAVKPDGPATWDDAETARDMLAELRARGQ